MLPYYDQYNSVINLNFAIILIMERDGNFSTFKKYAAITCIFFFIQVICTALGNLRAQYAPVHRLDAVPIGTIQF